MSYVSQVVAAADVLSKGWYLHNILYQHDIVYFVNFQTDQSCYLLISDLVQPAQLKIFCEFKHSRVLLYDNNCYSAWLRGH